MATKLTLDGSVAEGFVTLDGQVPSAAANPVGPAAGDLTGSYPSPIVRALYNQDIILVQSEADFPAPVGGVITISSAYLVTAFVTMTPGVRFSFAPTGLIVGIGSEVSGLFGDYDGSFISGAVSIESLTLENINLGASSELFFVSFPGFSTVEFCQLKGTRLGRLSNLGGTQWVNNLFDGLGEGLKVDQSAGSIQFINITVINTPASFIAFDILPTCTLLGAANWKLCSIITDDPGDRLIRISNLATLPGGVPPTSIVGIQINGCSLIGPGQILEEGVGFVTSRDLRLWSKGNGNLRDSGIAGIARFFDSTTSILQNYTGVGTWDVLETDNLAGGVIVLDADSERFGLTWNSTQDWYLEYFGAQNNIDFNIIWGIDLESVSSTNNLEFRVTRQIAGAGAWLDIVSSHSVMQQANRIQNATGFGVIAASPGDRYRLEVRPLIASNNSNVFKVYLSLVL